MGVFVHIAYCLFGIGLLILGSPKLFIVVKWMGALYLFWLGWQCLRAQPSSHVVGNTADDEPSSKDSTRGAWLTGFLTNVLNPKATLFFLALFSAGINPATPRLIQAFYGLWMAIVTILWFVFVSIVLTHPEIRARFLRISHWIERLTGVVLLGFAVRLTMASAR
jgi:threonine/homoserine/homoserine lactone efflux protein